MNAAPRRKYPQPPVAAPKSKALIIVRLVVTALVLVVTSVVLVVFMLTKDKQAPDDAPAVAAANNATPSTLPRPRTPTRDPGSTRAIPNLGLPLHRGAAAWAEDLSKSADSFASLHAAAVSEASSRLLAEADMLSGTRLQVDADVEKWRAAVAEVDARIEPLDAAADALDDMQWPLDDFIEAFVTMADLRKARDEARLRAHKSAQEFEDALGAYDTARDKLQTAMSGSNYQRALDDVTKAQERVNAARTARDESAEALTQADRTMTMRVDALTRLASDLPVGNPVTELWAAFKVLGEKVVAADERVAECEANLEEMLESIADQAEQVELARKDYKVVHDEFLRVAKAHSEAEARYQNRGGDALRREMERWGDLEREWKAKDRQAKKDLDETIGELSKRKSAHRIETQKLAPLEKASAEAVASTGPARDTLARHLEPERKRIKSEKAVRDAELAELEGKLDTLRTERAGKMQQLIDVENESTSLYRAMTLAQTRATRVREQTPGECVVMLRKVIALLEAGSRAQAFDIAQTGAVHLACIETTLEIARAGDELDEYRGDGAAWRAWVAALDSVKGTVSAVQSAFKSAMAAASREYGERPSSGNTAPPPPGR